MARAETDTAPLADVPLAARFGFAWWAGLAVCALLVVLLAYTLGVLVVVGVGVWGVNVPFVWGFDLINYAWWIGVANGASLFAAILVLRRHSLRTAVNRFAEAVALFAVICAGIFPIIHLGRPWLFYWVFPYPATYQVWPQFRSTLVWDFWAISTHAIITSLLLFVGLIPDFATMRDRAHGRRARLIYGVLALGWRGSLREWAFHQTAYRIVAISVLPLILLMQSTVAFEFAVTLVPDWHETRQPLHFVATGLVQGLGTVLAVAGLLRWGLGLSRFIDDADMDLLARLVLASALVTAYVYVDEFLPALIAEEAVRRATLSRLTGDYAFAALGAMAAGVILPQIYWFARMRTSVAAAVLVGFAVNLGIWLDRYSIIVGGVDHDHLPAMWRSYAPSPPEWGLLAGTVGLFGLLLLLFARLVPVVSMAETRHDELEDRA